MSIKKTFNIEIDEQTDYSNRFFYRNISTGLIIPIVGYRAEMHVKDVNGILRLSYSSEINGGIVLGGSAGNIDIYIPYEDTTNTVWDSGRYDIFLFTPTGRRIKFMKGFFIINVSNTQLADTILPDISSTVTPPLPQPNNLDVGGTTKLG